MVILALDTAGGAQQRECCWVSGSVGQHVTMDRVSESSLQCTATQRKVHFSHSLSLSSVCTDDTHTHTHTHRYTIANARTYAKQIICKFEEVDGYRD